MYEAHGLGGGEDLPIPANLAIAGGGAALAASFVILLVAWRRSRFDTRGHEWLVPLPAALVLDSRGFAASLRVLGLAATAFTAWAAMAGPDLLTNPAIGILFVWLWVGIVPTSLLFGRFYRAISPVRTLHLLLARVLGSSPQQGLLTYPERLGSWPAAAGLFAFVWFELVYPSATYLGPLRLWFACYLAAMLIGSAVFGERWFERADPFEVYSNVVAHLSPWSRNEQDRLVAVSPLRNLARLETGPGSVAVVAILLGSTAWDSFRGSLTWVRFLQGTSLNPAWANSVMLLLFVTIVGAVFAVATTLGNTSGGRPRGELPRGLAHSLVPIIVGYMVAHYLTLFVEYGQAVLAQVSDPLVTGADLFGTADREVNYWLSFKPGALASIKVLAIVSGHVVGAIAAHDRALRLLPAHRHLTGQLALLVVMVSYTVGGLALLFGV